MAGFHSAKHKSGYELVLTSEYRRWLKEQVAVLFHTKQAAGLSTIERPCVAVVVWSRPKNGRRHDIDGVKGPFDALTQSQIIKDDHLMSASAIVTVPPKGKGSMYLLLQELEEDTVDAQQTALFDLLELVSRGDK